MAGGAAFREPRDNVIDNHGRVWAGARGAKVGGIGRVGADERAGRPAGRVEQTKRSGRGPTWRPTAEPLEGRRLLSAGDPDPTFGAAGVASIGSGHDGLDGTVAVDYAANGKTVVAGGYRGAGAGPSAGFLARLDAAGRPDPTFGGGDGVIDVPGMFVNGARLVAVQPDGGIVAAGWFALPTRYRPDGSRDAGFVVPDLGLFAVTTLVAADGKVVLVGGRYDVDTDAPTVVVARLDGRTGQLDTTFGGGDGLTVLPAADANGSPDATFGPGGTLVIAARPPEWDDGRTLVLRLRADGSPDPTFGKGTGRVLVDSGPEPMYSPRVAVDGSGRTVLAYARSDVPSVTTLRLKPDGNLDKFFAPLSLATGVDRAGGVLKALATADGKVVLVGSGPPASLDLYPEARFGSFVARYTSAGQLDTTFGGGLGVQQTVGGGEPGADLLPDGRIVVAGGRPGDTGDPIGGSRRGIVDVVRLTVAGGGADASGVSLSADGTLRVAGTAKANSVVINDLAAVGKPGTLRVRSDGYQRVFAKSAVKRMTVDAGAGDDDVRVDAGTFAAPATLLGGAGKDTLTGGAGDDRIDGGAGDDYLRGDLWADADPTGVHTGNDTLLGGDGEDNLLGGGGGDTLDGGAGNDYLAGDYDGRDPGENTGNDTLRGGDGNDYLYGDDGNDTLDGGAGDDSLVGDPYDYGDGQPVVAGADTLRGGSGNDRLSGGAGPDRLEGGTGRDALDGGTGDDVLIGGNDADTLAGGTGNDRLDGGMGADRLLGGAGTDAVDYSARTAGVFVDLADTFVGKEGAAGEGDTVYSDVEIVLGGSGNDVLRGTEGADSLYGNGGDDTLDGRGGDDLLVGGSGKDKLTGGAGNDRLFGFSNTLTAGDGVPDLLDGGAGADKGRKDDKDVVLSIETFM